MAVAALTSGTVMFGDVKQAYSQAEWPSDVPKVLARLPLGYKRFYGGVQYCVEVGNLYGHPLAGKHWWLRFKRWMLEHKYTQSLYDPCLFVKTTKSDFLYVLVYVDDIVTVSPRNGRLREVWADLFTTDFQWTDFGSQPHEFLSVRVTQRTGAIVLDMMHYITEITQEHFPQATRVTYSTPAVETLAQEVHRAQRDKDTTYSDSDVSKRYRRIVMQLLYVASNCRPDLAIAVGLLSRVQAWASPTLLQHAERALLYAFHTRGLALTYTPSESRLSMHWSPNVLVGASDASHDIAHSTSAYVFLMANAAISWAVKKQQSIALTPYHAEVMAGSLAACETVFLRGLLTEMGRPPDKPTILEMDCSSAIDFAYDPVLHKASKHIERRDLFIRELVEREVLEPVKVKTGNNVSDALTKPLSKGAFLSHRARILNESGHKSPDEVSEPNV